MKKVMIISLIVALALCASLTACTDLISGVTVDELPEHVERLVLRVNGETPTYWRSEKAMCDSGDVVEGSLLLEAGYTLGELKVLINGEEIELEMLSPDRYAFSFTFHFNSKVSFEGAPELAKESGI